MLMVYVCFYNYIIFFEEGIMLVLLDENVLFFRCIVVGDCGF